MNNQGQTASTNSPCRTSPLQKKKKQSNEEEMTLIFKYNFAPVCFLRFLCVHQTEATVSSTCTCAPARWMWPAVRWSEWRPRVNTLTVRRCNITQLWQQQISAVQRSASQTPYSISQIKSVVGSRSDIDLRVAVAIVWTLTPPKNGFCMNDS